MIQLYRLIRFWLTLSGVKNYPSCTYFILYTYMYKYYKSKKKNLIIYIVSKYYTVFSIRYILIYARVWYLTGYTRCWDVELAKYNWWTQMFAFLLYTATRVYLYYNVVRYVLRGLIELAFRETKRKIIIITILKTQEEKLPLCIKRESFKPHEAATILRRRKRGIRQCHWNPPLQFLIRPKTLRHLGLPVEPIPGHCIFVCIGF